MGVHIEGFAEVSPRGRWEFVGRLVRNPEREYEPDGPELIPEEFFQSNSKELAAILTDTGRPIRSTAAYIPLVPLRGLPSDLSPELEAYLRGDEFESSSDTTWFTAREASEFRWADLIMRRRAYVPPEAAPLFAGCPRGFPMANWPAGIQVRIAGWSRDGIEVEWLESYAEIVPEFVGNVLPKLGRLGPPDRVRLIVAASW